jgi:CpeT protein
MASRIIYATLLCSFLVASCAVSKKTKGDADLGQLKGYMTGSFSSAAQAARDTNYFDITLHMYPIWPKREGHWLYVEQAVTANQAKPYRQRVYKLEQRDAQTFVSHVYTIKAEKEFVNAWKMPEKFEQLALEGIELKSGCEVVLKKEGNQFKGATGDKTCPSELRGASYATSKVTIHPDKIVSWDQGFNAEGKQVWGATLGGYEFMKKKD